MQIHLFDWTLNSICHKLTEHVMCFRCFWFIIDIYLYTMCSTKKKQKKRQHLIFNTIGEWMREENISSLDKKIHLIWIEIGEICGKTNGVADEWLRMNQRQKQTLQREWAHKNAGVETWGAFNGPPEFAMGSHSVVTSFCSMAESSLTRIESTYATAHCSRV